MIRCASSDCNQVRPGKATKGVGVLCPTCARKLQKYDRWSARVVSLLAKRRGISEAKARREFASFSEDLVPSAEELCDGGETPSAFVREMECGS